MNCQIVIIYIESMMPLGALLVWVAVKTID